MQTQAEPPDITRIIKTLKSLLLAEYIVLQFCLTAACLVAGSSEATVFASAVLRILFCHSSINIYNNPLVL